MGKLMIAVVVFVILVMTCCKVKYTPVTCTILSHTAGGSDQGMVYATQARCEDGAIESISGVNMYVQPVGNKFITNREEILWIWQ